jgi:adenine deaminase
LRAPFMSLSFLALPVIPKLKMTDLGLFDVDRFGFVGVELGDG